MNDKIIRNSVYVPRQASEVFETHVMKTDEVVLFIQGATEGGVDLETAYEDMRTIDALLHLTRLHLVVHGEIKRTKAGYLRKGTTIYDAMNDVIESRCLYDRINNE